MLYTFATNKTYMYTALFQMHNSQTSTCSAVAISNGGKKKEQRGRLEERPIKSARLNSNFCLWDTGFISIETTCVMDMRLINVQRVARNEFSRDNYAITYASQRFKIDRIPVIRRARLHNAPSTSLLSRSSRRVAHAAHGSHYAHGKAFTAVEYNVKNDSHMLPVLFKIFAAQNRWRSKHVSSRKFLKRSLIFIFSLSLLFFFNDYTYKMFA